MVNLVPLCDFLTVPDVHEQDVAEDYVRRLNEFSHLASVGVLRFVPSAGSINTLHRLRRFPFIGDIKKLFRSANVTAYAAEDVNRVLTKILTQSHTFENLCKLEDVLYGNEIVDPELSSIPGVCSDNSEFHTDGMRVLVSSALWQSAESSSTTSGMVPSDDLVIGLACPSTDSVRVVAVVEEIEGTLPIALPSDVTQTIRTAGAPAVFLRHVERRLSRPGAHPPHPREVPGIRHVANWGDLSTPTKIRDAAAPAGS